MSRDTIRHPSSSPRRSSTAIRGLATIAALAIVLAACGGDDSMGGDVAQTDDAGAPAMGGFDGDMGEIAESGAAERDMAADDAADGADDTAEDGDAETTTANGNGATAAANAGRRVIRTATLELELEDTADAAERIVAIATDAGGFVAETDLQRDREGVVRGSITLRVPSAELFDTVDQLDELAVAVPVRRIDERDVTAQTTDLRAQRDNLRTYETELNALLTDIRDSAERANELLVVFERIREVRGEIDRIDAHLASLGDQVALATITVALVPAASALPVTDPTWSAGETIRDALTTTARALTNIADGAIVFVLTVLPIALLLLAPLLIPAVWIWRRQRRRRAGGEGGGPADDGPPATSPPADDGPPATSTSAGARQPVTTPAAGERPSS
jgi:hypothetical protein